MNSNKAASFAARIQESLGTTVELEAGRFGQFEIVVDGRTVLSRKGGLLAKLMRKPWPSEGDAVSAVRDALQT